MSAGFERLRPSMRNYLGKVQEGFSIKILAVVTAIGLCAGTMTSAAAFTRGRHEGDAPAGGFAHGRVRPPPGPWGTRGVRVEDHGILSRWGTGHGLGVFGYDDRPWVRDSYCPTLD